MAIELDEHDQALVDTALAALRQAHRSAHHPTAVARRLSVVATSLRNQGRQAAIRRHPFEGKCEESGRPLDQRDAVLDELDPEKGYAGRVRWVCPKANNSGRRSCGGC